MAKPVSHKCVQRLMQNIGLRALIRVKKRSRQIAGKSDVHVPNVLQRNVFAKAPNQKWVTDVTKFNVNGQKLYLSACIDRYNGEIIAHRMAKRPVFELVSGTVCAALSNRGVTQSMSRKGNCFDNAVIESFFGTLKAEYFHLATLDGLAALEAGVHHYIHYFNHERIKLRLRGLSPGGIPA